jgi:signal transduction histidine kinase
MILPNILDRVTRYTAVLTIITGAAVLAGWLLNIPIVATLLPQMPSMPFNSALGFIAAGTALLLYAKRAMWARLMMFICIGITGALGSLTLAEYLFGLDLGIDQLFVREFTLDAASAGRMSAASALNFSLLSLGLILLALNRLRRLQQAVLLLVGSIAYVAVLGFLYDVVRLYELFLYSQIAPHTAVLFLLLVTGMITAQPDLKVWNWLLADDDGGRLSRRLMPVALLLPILLGWMIIEIERNGLLNLLVGSAVLVLLLSMLFVLILGWTGYLLHTREEARHLADQNRFELAVERERMDLLASFIKNTSHDLRTPLTSINTSVYLAMRTEDAEQRTKRLHHIEAQVQQISGILDQFTILANLDALTQLKLSPVQINLLVAEVVEQTRRSLDDRQIRIETGISRDASRISGDETYLTMALTQLLDNAIRYTPDGGSICVRTERRDQFMIETSDTGSGIDLSTLPHIFERYFKGQKARTTDGSRSGLGLSIVKRIVELHHGRIEVESEPGQGSTFRIYLPILQTNMDTM